MPPRKQQITLFITYSLIILGTLYFSGMKREKKLYDKFIIKPEGSIFYTEDITASKQFYMEIMDFNLLKKPPKDDDLVGFSLPAKHKLYLKSCSKCTISQEAGKEGVMVFRVRNGFENLHKTLSGKLIVARNKHSASLGALKSAGISAISDNPWGREFTVADLDNNKLIFYRPKKFSLSRLK